MPITGLSARKRRRGCVSCIGTAEIELNEGIYAAKEYLDAWLRQAVDEMGESRIEVRENDRA